jgi:hypothetical protein
MTIFMSKLDNTKIFLVTGDRQWDHAQEIARRRGGPCRTITAEMSEAEAVAELAMSAGGTIYLKDAGELTVALLDRLVFVWRGMIDRVQPYIILGYVKKPQYDSNMLIDRLTKALPRDAAIEVVR